MRLVSFSVFKFLKIILVNVLMCFKAGAITQTCLYVLGVVAVFIFCDLGLVVCVGGVLG